MKLDITYMYITFVTVKCVLYSALRINGKELDTSQGCFARFTPITLLSLCGECSSLLEECKD